MIRLSMIGRVAVVAGTLAAAGPAAAATQCQNTGSFDAWLKGFRAEAAQSGLSKRALSVLDGVQFDPGIVKKDRAQNVFSDSWLTFSGKLISAGRLKTGAAKIAQHRATFDRIQKTYGVPAEVITAFWALETDFGGFMGKDSTIRSLATLAYDCRRPEKFRPELMAALRLIDKGDLRPDEMIGAWAGEIGQTQFLPTYYDKYAVDFDGDGHRNMIHSTADALASAANYMRALGWTAGQPWIEEVKVPRELPWEQADVSIKLPRSQWAQWGVTKANGKPLKADKMASSLVLPMGRNGPAFLTYPNFDAYLVWNESLTYSLTAAYLATRYAGAPKVSPGRAEVATVGHKEILAIQNALIRQGYDVGGADGRLGLMTRRAIRDLQMKLGLPADGYPSPELMARLRS